jgi:hypothetical protein
VRQLFLEPIERLVRKDRLWRRVQARRRRNALARRDQARAWFDLMRAGCEGNPFEGLDAQDEVSRLAQISSGEQVANNLELAGETPALPG